MLEALSFGASVSAEARTTTRRADLVDSAGRETVRIVDIVQYIVTILFFDSKSIDHRKNIYLILFVLLPHDAPAFELSCGKVWLAELWPLHAQIDQARALAGTCR